MISFREFLLEVRALSHIEDWKYVDNWKKYLDTTFVELPDGRFKIKVGNNEGAVEFDRTVLKQTLRNVVLKSEVKTAMGYKGHAIPQDDLWKVVSDE